MSNARAPVSHRSELPAADAPAISDRQDAADELLYKQGLLAEAQRIAQLGSWWQDSRGHIIWSDEMYRINGFAPKAFVPSADSIQALIHPDDRIAIRARMAAAFDDGVVAEFEFRVVRPDGSERHIIARTEAVADIAGQVARLTGTFQDITARKQAEAEVREAAERYRQLFEANPHPMWIYDPATLQFLAINDAAVGRYGYQREEFLSMKLNDLLIPEDVPALTEIAQRIDDARKSSLWRHRLKDGRLIDMEIIAQTIDFEGRPARVVLAHDVTERRRAAQDVLDSRAALRALVQRLQSAQEDERARISRQIHDEFGQMLTGLKFDLSWIERRLSEPETALQRNALLDRTIEASVLVDQIIVAVQNLAAELRPGALDHLGLAAALAQYARQFQHRSGITCTVEVTEPLPELLPAVADDLFYICKEALTNVARHAHATQVHLRLLSFQDEVRLSIEDNGIGIDPAVATAQRSLGLLGMRERALQCAGSVEINAASPHGTVVVVQVPLRGAGG